MALVKRLIVGSAMAALVGCIASPSGNGDSSSARTGNGANPAADSNGVGKTTICHIPPGNPANMHTITVGNPAVPAHLAHGDKIGACGDGTGTVTPPGSTNPPTDGNPGTTGTGSTDNSGGTTNTGSNNPGSSAGPGTPGT